MINLSKFGASFTKELVIKMKEKTNIKLPIYLDYQSTTPVDPRVIEVMTKVLKEDFGNPTEKGLHRAGTELWNSQALGQCKMALSVEH